MPFSEHDSVNHPVSLYAASKKSNDLWLILTAIFMVCHLLARFSLSMVLGEGPI